MTQTTRCPVTGASAAPASFEPLDPRIRRDPFPYYRWLREAAQHPVYKVPSENNFWIVTGYNEVKTILTDPWTFDGNPYPELEPRMLSIFPPDRHRIARGVVQSMFTPSAIERMTPAIERIANHYTAKLVRQRHCDLMATWALPIPLRVISSMFGLPEDDVSLQRLHRWGVAGMRLGIPLGGTGPKRSRLTPGEAVVLVRELAQSVPDLWKIYRLAGREGFGFLSVPPSTWRDPDRPRPNVHALASLHHAIAMIARLLELVDERRKQPGSATDAAVIDRFVEASRENRVSPIEMVAALAQILVAGYETTGASLGHAVHRLVREPALWAELKAEPSRIGAFVEENLRLEAPLQRTLRRTTRAVEIAGHQIPANAYLIIVLGAANCDPAVFPDGERFALGRANKQAHLTFGKGIHHCIGAVLNRVESELALRALLSRVERIELAGEASYVVDRDIGLWSLERLRVVVT
jgi:cytochrome P450